MIISHKIRLDPNNKQATYFAKACGTARFAYNWALAEWQTQYAAWKEDNTQPKPSQFSLRKQLNAIKREQFPWMLEVTKTAPQMAIIQLGAAFGNFFAGRAKYPQFKKKGKSRDSFTLTNDQFSINACRNRQKAKAKLAKLHARIANIRKDTLHQLTTDLTHRFSLIGIEDLNVSGMVKNRHLSRAISDMGFFEFRRQLEYKAAMRGGLVVVADRFFASSKTCSACGDKIEKLPLSVRQWDCPSCGASHDRDVNAAINLANYAVSYTVSACGGEGSGLGRKPKTKPAPVKQEFDGKFDDVQVCISSK